MISRASLLFTAAVLFSNCSMVYANSLGLTLSWQGVVPPVSTMMPIYVKQTAAQHVEVYTDAKHNKKTTNYRLEQYGDKVKLVSLKSI